MVRSGTVLNPVNSGDDSGCMHRRRLLLAAGALASVASLTGVAMSSGLTGGSARRVAILPTPAATSMVTPTTAAPETTTSTSAAPTTAAPTTNAPVPAPPSTRAPVTVPRTTTVPRSVAAVAPKPAAVVAARPATASSAGASSDYTLIGYRWNPCKTITVSSSGPDVSGVVSELSALTGIRMQMVSGPALIMVGWGDVPVGGGEVGVTSWRASGKWMIGGTIVLSQQGAPYLPTLLRHELGHAIGLGHAGQSNEIMYPVVSSGAPTDYQAGDRAGLHALGIAAGC